MIKKEVIQKKVLSCMRTKAVKVCMDQGSVGFENYLQLNLAGCLKKAFPGHTIRVEEDGSFQADILMCSGSN